MTDGNCYKTHTLGLLFARCRNHCACHTKLRLNIKKWPEHVAAQTCALFQHLNIQKWSGHVVPFAFWLGNLLRATMACTFWASQLTKTPSTCSSPNHRATTLCTFWTSRLPKVVQACGVLTILTWNLKIPATPAKTFSTSHLPRVLRTWGVFLFWLQNLLPATTACNCSSLMWRDGSATAVLASLLFDLPEPQHSGKTKCSTAFLPCRHRTDMDFHVLNAQTVPIWSPSQSLWAQLQRNMTYWRQLRLQGIATSARSTLKHACIPLFPTFLALLGARVRVAYFWLVWAWLQRQMPQTGPTTKTHPKRIEIIVTVREPKNINTNSRTARTRVTNELPSITRCSHFTWKHNV